MFIAVPKALAVRVRRAIAKLEGYPIRGVVVGGPDFTSDFEGAGWTTDALEEGDDDGATACLEIPPHLEKHLGKTVKVGTTNVKLPTADALANEDALPATLRAIKQARRDAARINSKATSEEDPRSARVRVPDGTEPIGKGTDAP